MKKKILYITPYISDEIAKDRKLSKKQIYAAGQLKMEGICKVIDKAGYEVDIISPIGIFNNLSRTLIKSKLYSFQNGKSCIFVPLTLNVKSKILRYIFLTLSTCFLAMRISSKNQYLCCIFYNYTPVTLIPSICLKIVKKTPIVLEIEDDYSNFQYNRLIKYFNIIFIKLTQDFLDGIISVNSLLLNRFKKIENVVIVRGIFNQIFKNKDNTTGVNTKITNKPKAIFSGSLNEIRGIDILLKALEFINYELEILITGKGDLKEEDLRTKNNNVNIKYLGFIPYEEYLRLLNDADIGISCYKVNTPMKDSIFPSKIIEYMASGKIIITSKVADIEIMGKDLFIFYDNDSPLSLAKAINKVLQNLSYYKIYGEKAQKYIKDNYSIDALSIKFKQFFKYYEN